MNKILATLLLMTSVFLAAPAAAYEDTLDGLLSAHLKIVTKNGIQYNGVNYDAWGKDARHKEVLDAILSTNPAAIKGKSSKLAYWINAYNVLTVDLITSKGERESIKNLGNLITSPWKKHKWTISGKSYSLDEIEHKIIRPLGEPRIHFAINCAAKSCPDLRKESYRASKLDAQLADQVKKTFANTSKGYQKLDGKNAIRVTKVMDWFDEDFNNGDLNAWLKPYFPDIIQKDTDIGFFDYDWSLNAQ